MYMFKKIIVFLVLTICSNWVFAQTIPNFGFATLEGDSIHLSQFAGKRIFITIIPVAHTSENELALKRIDSLNSKFSSNNVLFIGIPAIDDGYADSLQLVLHNLYRDTMQLQMIIVKGTNAYNSSGSLQHDLFKWLSQDSLNGHFSVEISKPGITFFINEEGGLKAVFAEDTIWNDRLMDLIL